MAFLDFSGDTLSDLLPELSRSEAMRGNFWMAPLLHNLLSIELLTCQISSHLAGQILEILGETGTASICNITSSAVGKSGQAGQAGRSERERERERRARPAASRREREGVRPGRPGRPAGEREREIRYEFIDHKVKTHGTSNTQVTLTTKPYAVLKLFLNLL